MNTHLKLSNNLGSFEIWSDKLKVLYNRHTESRRDGGKHNITEVLTAQRATEV